MEARIIGLKGCGKTTLVSALAQGRGEGHIATVHVGDARVRALSEIFRPKKTTFAELKVREVAWPEASARKGEMERYLDALAGGQVYLHVLRAFENPTLGESVDPERDLTFVLLTAGLLEEGASILRHQRLSDMVIAAVVD